jgi:hypothetical protein
MQVTPYLSSTSWQLAAHRQTNERCCDRPDTWLSSVSAGPEQCSILMISELGPNLLCAIAAHLADPGK